MQLSCNYHTTSIQLDIQLTYNYHATSIKHEYPGNISIFDGESLPSCNIVLIMQLNILKITTTEKLHVEKMPSLILLFTLGNI